MIDPNASDDDDLIDVTTAIDAVEWRGDDEALALATRPLTPRLKKIAADTWREVEDAIARGWALEVRSGHVSPPAQLVSGKANPLAALGECGDPKCSCFRIDRPTVRDSFAAMIVEKVVATRSSRIGVSASFDEFRATRRGLSYVSVGSGCLYFDFDVLRRLRTRGVRLASAVFVDPLYDAVTSDNRRGADALEALGSRGLCRAHV